VKHLFVCTSCERPSAQWSGKCSSCGSWGTVSEHPAGGALRVAGRGVRAAPVLTLGPDPEEHRISTGFPNVDRVLGGGLVPGSVVLLAGAPGIGKSTLLLQLASRLTEAGHPCLLASGEEARGQIASRARRLGLLGEGMSFVSGRNLDEVLEAARVERPDVLIVDSIHTIRHQEAGGLPGGVAQVRVCADALVSLAKEEGITVLLIGHVTKGGDLAGPRTLEHAVDQVLTFEGDAGSGLRVLSGGKNRYGPEGEVAWFEMGSTGLSDREGGPGLRESGPEPGCTTTLALAGRRAFAVDVQALVVPSEGPPKRQVAGLDPRRFHIVAAVTDRATNLRVIRSELFGASSGGLRLEDPGTDLAIAAALASAASGRPAPAASAFVGEVSLTGSVRAVPGIEQRLSAAKSAGLETVFLPHWGSGRGPVAGGLRLVPVRHIKQALGWALAGRKGSEAVNGL
jgi:DNA repair protein RadA/Sms